MAQWTEQNPRKRTKQNGDSQPIICRAQNTGDQDAHRTPGGRQPHKTDSGRKDGYISEVKKNLQGTNSGGEGAETQMNNLGHKEEISIQPEQQGEKRILKNKDSIRTIWDISKHTNIQIIGMPEGEEKEQEIENLSEKLMKENFPNLSKEIDM